MVGGVCVGSVPPADVRVVVGGSEVSGSEHGRDIESMGGAGRLKWISIRLLSCEVFHQHNTAWTRLNLMLEGSHDIGSTSTNSTVEGSTKWPTVDTYRE